MTVLYVGYLVLALTGTLLLSRVFNVRFSAHHKKSVVKTLILTAIVFTAWDVLAVVQNHWSFGLQHTLGIILYNQPLEEMGFFFIIPFFGIVLYEIVRAKGEKAK